MLLSNFIMATVIASLNFIISDPILYWNTGAPVGSGLGVLV